MRALCIFVCFGLNFGACESECDVEDHANRFMHHKHLGIMAVASCPSVDTTDVVIDLNTFTPFFNEEMTIRKNVFSPDHAIMATAYVHGDEAMTERYQWAIEDSYRWSVNSLAWDNNTVEIHATQDFFDNNEVEPKSVVTVCAVGLCDITLGCQTVTIAGVLDLEGDWDVFGGDSPKPFPIYVTQTGRTIQIEPTIGDTLIGELRENVLLFEDHELLYTCTFTSRTNCDGTVIDTRTNEIVESWTAQKQ